MNIRFAGFGGQGIVMAGYVLGHAGVLGGANALQTQSYGSESRGGACKSDVVLSDGEILDLAPTDTDVLVAMSQPALDKYLVNLKPDGKLIYDSVLVKADAFGGDALGVPATDLAHTTFGRDVVANVIMLGCLAGMTGCVEHDICLNAIEQNVPPRTREMNRDAFELGYKYGVGPTEP